MTLKKPHYLPGDKLEDGTLYVGIMSDGKKVYHLSVETYDYASEKMDWYEAIKIEGLPTIQEMNLIAANAKALGLGDNTKYYWSATESNNNYAWYERFSDGYQLYNGVKNSTYYIRCVRRYSIIQPFDHLKAEIAGLKARIAEIEKETGGV